MMTQGSLDEGYGGRSVNGVQSAHAHADAAWSPAQREIVAGAASISATGKVPTQTIQSPQPDRRCGLVELPSDLDMPDAESGENMVGFGVSAIGLATTRSRTLASIVVIIHKVSLYKQR